MPGRSHFRKISDDLFFSFSVFLPLHSSLNSLSFFIIFLLSLMEKMNNAPSSESLKTEVSRMKRAPLTRSRPNSEERRRLSKSRSLSLFLSLSLALRLSSGEKKISLFVFVYLLLGRICSGDVTSNGALRVRFPSKSRATRAAAKMSVRSAAASKPACCCPLATSKHVCPRRSCHKDEDERPGSKEEERNDMQLGPYKM